MNDHIKKILKATRNASVAALVGAVATAILGRAAIYKEYVSINNMTTLYNEYLVITGLVDEGILADDLTLANRVEYIGESIQKTQAIYEEELETAKNTYDSLYQDYEMLKNKYDQIQQEKLNLENMTTATLFETDVIISGEKVNTTTKDFVATVNGHTYYLEEFLNEFLPEKLSGDLNGVQYGENLPEKVNVVKQERMLANNNGFVLYNQNDTFYMGGEAYNSGLVNASTWQDCSIYINANGMYSKLVFTIAHIDNTNTSHRTLNISYLGADGEYILGRSLDLYGGMQKQEVSIDIFNTDTIKLEMTQGRYEQFGLADVYLVK